ncbi:hypothetical protein KP696_15810 [Nocardia seriolae]|uniref:hypothetical protein n=1 Tax=Nocardia seriolae TaxID=37332 RepID=UPI003F87E650
MRDAIITTLSSRPNGATIDELVIAVSEIIGHPVARSSVRSYLRLNTPGRFIRTGRGAYKLGSKG